MENDLQNLKNPKVAFIAHPTDMNMYRSYIRYLKPDKTYDDKLLLKLFEWSPSYKIAEWKNLSFDNIDFFDAMFVMVPFLPEMKDISLKKIVEKIDQALTIASDKNYSVAALGAFTSIVLQGQEKDFAQKHNMVLTSGNSLTAATIVRSIEQISSTLGVALDECTLGIIGASGDIGSACVAYMQNKVKAMILTARSEASLQTMVKSLASGSGCDMKLTTDNKAAVAKSDIVLFVTSSYVPMFSQNDFMPGTIVCDASAPLNVRVSSQLRDDVFIYHGGILSLPFTIDPGFDIGLASPNTFYGCQIEGALLALDASLPYSWGRGNISMKKIGDFIRKLYTVPNLRIAYSVGTHTYLQANLHKYKQVFSRIKNKQFLECA